MIAEKSVIKVDPRMRRSREMLQQAMRELLKEKEFAEINVQDIALRADLNRATFYKHYLDKYDLLDAIIRQRLQTLLDESLAPESTLTLSNVNILIQTVHTCLQSFHGDCQVNHARNENNALMQQIQRQIYEVLLNWLRHATVEVKARSNGYSTSHSTGHTNGRAKMGSDAPDHAPETLALLTSWIIFGPLMQVVWGAYLLPKEEVIRQVASSVESVLKEYLIA